MSTTTRDFWPNDLAVSTVLTPIAILKEQAALLTEKTNGLIVGDVESRRPSPYNVHEYARACSDDGLVHIFRLIVPALDDYCYELLSIIHPVQLYPLELRYSPTDTNWTVTSEEEFVEVLKNVLSCEATLNVIRSLVAQAQA